MIPISQDFIGGIDFFYKKLKFKEYELNDIKQRFNDERRTEIRMGEVLELDDEDLIDEDDDFYDEDGERPERSERKVHISYACEDCDYRWDDVIVRKRGEEMEEDFDRDIICPMCGSVNITLI